jgi:hypothetical protein
MKHILVCLSLAAAVAFAQAPKKQRPSPSADTSVTISGKTLTVKYSAPSLRGRKFIGGIHQLGQVWRAGANEATAFHTDADLDLGGLAVPKGDYTLYVLLGEPWQLIVNKQTGQWGTVYKQDQDLGRVKMTMSKPDAAVETYKVTLSSKGGTKGELQLAWDTSVATVPITVK